MTDTKALSIGGPGRTLIGGVSVVTTTFNSVNERRLRKNILFRVVELVIFSVPAFRHIPTGHILRLAASLGGKCEKEPKGPLFLIYYLLGRYDYRVIEGGFHIINVMIQNF